MRTLRRVLIVLSVVLAGTSWNAAAQDDPQPSRVVSVPADQFVMAPGGVDLRSGRYVYSNIDLSIGGTGQPSSLTLTRTMVDSVLGHYNPFGNFSDNWEMMITVVQYDVIKSEVPPAFARKSISADGHRLSIQRRAWAMRSNRPATMLP